MNPAWIHFNSQLIYNELIKRGISCQIISHTEIIKATLWDHIEYIEWTDLSIMPANYKLLLDSKWHSKKLLEHHKISIPKWYKIKEGNIADFKEKLWKLDFPLVMKPEFWSHGYEVRMNIEDEIEANEIFKNLSREIHHRSIVLEEQCPWNEFRIMVTKNWFFGCLYRWYPKVIWDGTSTIEELIKKINIERNTKRKNALCRIYIDHELKRFLKKQWINLRYIPKKWESIIVRSNSNVSTWGGCQEVSNTVDPFFKDLAQKILNIFPGLPYIWIDVITKDISQVGSYVVCELNPSPGISLHTHPESGEKNDLPKYMVDLLFPETIV